ncbi:MAG: hypothetical protein RL226_1960 [Bacteroidota bacterium]
MIDLEKDYVLEDDRVRLTPLTSADFAHLEKFSIHEPDLWEYSLMQAGSPEKMKHYLEQALEGRRNKHSYPFLVFDKQKGEYAGSTRLYDIQPTHSSTQLGFTWYGKEFQGTGINPHCKHLLLGLCFDVWQLHRVEFRADAENKRSINAMKRIGCVEEGILRSNTFKTDGSRRNSIVLSILRTEWQQSVEQKIKDLFERPR